MQHICCIAYHDYLSYVAVLKKGGFCVRESFARVGAFLLEASIVDECLFESRIRISKNLHE